MRRVVLFVLLLAVGWTAMGCETSAVRRTVASSPSRPGRRHLEKAEVYLKRGLNDSALAAFGLALIENPRLIEAHMGMGDIYLKRDDYPKAHRSYESAVALNAQSFDALYYLGLTRQLMGRVDEAIQTYLSVAPLNPNHFEVNLNLASAYLMLGEAQTALPYIRRAVSINPESPGAMANLAAVYSLLGQWENAVQAYRDAMELGEIPEPVVLGLADAHLHLGNYELALNTLQAHVRRVPNATAYERLGYAQFKLKQFNNALASYKMALSIDDDDVASLNGVGVCAMTVYIQSGGLEKDYKDVALTAWRKSIRLQPDQSRIVDLLSRYENIFDPTKKYEKPWYKR